MSTRIRIAAFAMAAAVSLAVSAPALAEGNLAIYAWADSISPEMVAKFEKETGIKVTVDAFSSNEGRLLRL